MIATCCSTPLVFTFMFSGSEYYCIKCARTYGVLGVPEMVDETEARRETVKANREIFRKYSEDCIPNGSRFDNCDKCGKGDYHIQHASAEEKEKSSNAYGVLYKGNLA